MMVRETVVSGAVVEMSFLSETNIATLKLSPFVGQGELRVCFFAPGCAAAWPLRCTAALRGSGPGWIVSDMRGGAILSVDIGPGDVDSSFTLLVRVDSRDVDEP